MSISDWINVGGQVVDLASSIASLFGEDRKKSDPQSFDLGALQFGVSGNSIYAGNPSTSSIALNFSQTQQQGVSVSTTTSPLKIPPQSGVDITKFVESYQAGGTFLIAPSDSPSTEDIGQAISFAIKTIAIGATIAIIGGITGSFGKNQDGTWFFSVTSSGPRLLSGSVSVTDQSGITASANLSFSQSNNIKNGLQDYNGGASFPSGLNLSPTIQNVLISLVVPSESVEYEKLQYLPLVELPAFKDLKRA